MNFKFVLTLLIGLTINQLKAQFIFNEPFFDVPSINANGWGVLNSSGPTIGTVPQGWFQGNPAVFGAFAAPGTNEYIAANFNAVAGTGTISAWLVSAAMPMVNGTTISFYTRIPAGPVFPDRLELRLSTAGAASTLSAAPMAVGSYTTLLLSVNPTLNTTAYPNTWTQFTATVTGVPYLTFCSAAFRYFVTNGGPTGANSSYIGVDSYQVNTPCTSVTAIPSSATICPGQSVTLEAKNSIAYTWLPGGATTETISVSPTVTTTYTLQGTFPGCPNTQTTVTVFVPTPTISINATSTIVCASGSTSLTASGGTSYTWSPGATLNTTNGANVVASPTGNTTYTVIGFDGTCSNTSTIQISIAAAVNPTVNSSSPNYCIGGNPVTLTANGASTYTWSPAISLNTNTGAVVSATPQVNTTYTLTGAIGSCTADRTISINVIPESTVGITAANNPICIGGTGTNLTGSGAVSYTWAPSGTVGNSINVNPTTNTTYTVIGQTSIGCVTLPSVITVSVNPPINPTVSASTPSVCSTKTLNLSVLPSGPGFSYTWTPTAQIQGSTSTATIIARPNIIGNVVYSVTVFNGICAETQTISIQSFECIPPTSSFTTITSNSVCTTECVTFTATSTGGQPLSYQWIFPGGTPSSSTDPEPEVCYSAKGNYSVTLITTSPFGSDTTRKNNYINVADIPDFVVAFGDTLVKIGQSAPISAIGADFYSWSPGASVACPTCSNTTAQPITTTEYVVTGYNSPVCFKTDTILVRVDPTCGDFFVPNAFSPNGDGLNETINVHGFCLKTFTLQIFNRWGEKVFETSSKTDSWDGTYKGKALDTGVFVYKADGTTIDNKTFSIKGNITLIR